MDESPEQSGSKISLVEALLIGLVLVIVWLLNLIPFVGDVTSPIAGALMFFYLYQKGLLGTSTVAVNLIGYLCGLIPILQALPTEIIAWVVTVIIANSPELEAIAERIGQVEELGEGAAGEAGAAEGATAEAGISAEATTATASQGQTIEMTQTADGTYEYKGAGSSETTPAGESVSGAPETQQDENQNRRPSEESTERRPTENENAENPQRSPEEEVGQAQKDQLEAEMQTESEKSPEEEAGRKDFDVIQGGRDQPQNQQEDDESEGDEDQIADVKKAA